jgi:hypothetical protein
MDIGLLQKHFGLMGARLKFDEVPSQPRWRARRSAGIDIQSDAKGEVFVINFDPQQQVEYEVVDLQPDLRHLLLLARRDGRKDKFLCGHDERHWFVCAVPGGSVNNVTAAMQALQPVEVQAAVRQKVKRQKNRLRRRNEAFVRQGEWFFLPQPGLSVDEKRIYRNEPLSRGAGSKPHMCQFLFRNNGEQVMVCRKHPTGLLLKDYQKLIAANPAAIKWGWRQMVRNAAVYVKGRVWHPDHKTIVLDGWHRVLMNTENLAPHSASVVFLD